MEYSTVQLLERLVVLETQLTDLKRCYEEFKALTIERMVEATKVGERVALIESQSDDNVRRFEERAELFYKEMTELKEHIQQHDLHIQEYDKYKFTLTVLYPVAVTIVSSVLAWLFTNAKLVNISH